MAQKHIQCKFGPKCKFIKTGDCKYWHPPCNHGWNCSHLRYLECGYYHPEEHYRIAQQRSIKYSSQSQTNGNVCSDNDSYGDSDADSYDGSDADSYDDSDDSYDNADNDSDDDADNDINDEQSVQENDNCFFHSSLWKKRKAEENKQEKEEKEEIKEPENKSELNLNLKECGTISFGTKDYEFTPLLFKPNCIDNNKTFVYQNICVSHDRKFSDASLEELQFADRYPITIVNNRVTGLEISDNSLFQSYNTNTNLLCSNSKMKEIENNHSNNKNDIITNVYKTDYTQIDMDNNLTKVLKCQTLLKDITSILKMDLHLLKCKELITQKKLNHKISEFNALQQTLIQKEQQLLNLETECEELKIENESLSAVKKENNHLKGVQLNSLNLKQLFALQTLLQTSLGRIGKQIQAQHKNLQNCCICYENPKETVFKPCKHMVVCCDCSSKLQTNRCPLCNAEIEEEFKVFV